MCSARAENRRDHSSPSPDGVDFATVAHQVDARVVSIMSFGAACLASSRALDYLRLMKPRVIHFAVLCALLTGCGFVLYSSSGAMIAERAFMWSSSKTK